MSETITLPEEHFGNELQHESLQSQEGIQYLSKYNSVEDALVAGLNASKLVGKPFRLPESIDKLPDDKTRSEFKTGAFKALGYQLAEKPEDLTDIKWTQGLKEGATADDKLIAKVSQFAIEKGIPKSILQEFVNLNNALTIEMQEQFEQAHLAQVKAVNDELVKQYGDEKKVAEATELVKRMFGKNVSPEDFEKVGEELATSGMLTKPLLTKALMKMSESYREGATQEGAGGAGTQQAETLQQRTARELPKTAKALGYV